MSEVIFNMPIDGNDNPIQALPLQAPAEVDGSAPAEAHTAALTGGLNGKGIVRISAVTALRFLVGAAVAANATSHNLPEGGEIWLPFKTGDIVSVYGGIASVAVAGVVVS